MKNMGYLEGDKDPLDTLALGGISMGGGRWGGVWWAAFKAARMVDHRWCKVEQHT